VFLGTGVRQGRGEREPNHYTTLSRHRVAGNTKTASCKRHTYHWAQSWPVRLLTPSAG
jgi:hypothetical protein